MNDEKKMDIACNYLRDREYITYNMLNKELGLIKWVIWRVYRIYLGIRKDYNYYKLNRLGIKLIFGYDVNIKYARFHDWCIWYSKKNEFIHNKDK